MKKIISLIVVAVLLATVAFAGCAQQAPAASEEPSQSAEASESAAPEESTGAEAVSYTHLDVYKRQRPCDPEGCAHCRAGRGDRLCGPRK